MGSLLNDICATGPVLTDGAWGTQLQARGLQIGECPDAWNLTHPDRVSDVALEYVAAGSRIILTNTFRANQIALERHSLAKHLLEINREGARLSRTAAGDKAMVFGSIGPTGDSMSTGGLSRDDALRAFDEQANALAEIVDGFVIETMTDLDEATSAVQSASETGLPVVACIVFAADGNCMMSGVSIDRAVGELIGAGAQAVGSNCGFSPQQMLRVSRHMRKLTDLPIWMKPNAGLPDMKDGRPVYKISPEQFAMEALALVEAGADFIGGCCGTTPEHMMTIAELLRQPADGVR